MAQNLFDVYDVGTVWKEFEWLFNFYSHYVRIGAKDFWMIYWEYWPVSHPLHLFSIQILNSKIWFNQQEN
jgi:hypothetical protein